MQRLLYQPCGLSSRLHMVVARRTLRAFSSSSTALKVDKLKMDMAERSQGVAAEINRLGIRRYLDVHKSSSLLLSAKERAESFDNLWSKIKNGTQTLPPRCIFS